MSAIDKYQDELFLQLVKGESNSGAAGNNTDGNEIRTKLLLLSHFIGDSHQPLHVDLRHDLNGNSFPVKWFGNSNGCFGKKCSLHKVWDTMLIAKRLKDFAGDESRMADHIISVFDLIFDATGAEKHLFDQSSLRGNAAEWASNSVRLASEAYLPGPDFDVGEWYYNATIPIVELQLFKAGHSIAQSLNFVFNQTETCDSCFWHKPLCRPAGQQPRPSFCFNPIV